MNQALRAGVCTLVDNAVQRIPFVFTSDMKDRWRNEYAMVISRNSGLSFSFRFQGLLGTFYYISTQKKDLD